MLKGLQEAQKAQYQAMQAYAEQQASAPAAEAPFPSGDVAMDVDEPQSTRGTKRSAEDSEPASSNKKLRLGAFSLTRDIRSFAQRRSFRRTSCTSQTVCHCHFQN